MSSNLFNGIILQMTAKLGQREDCGQRRGSLAAMLNKIRIGPKMSAKLDARMGGEYRCCAIYAALNWV